jgi:hypothetical protein
MSIGVAWRSECECFSMKLNHLFDQGAIVSESKLPLQGSRKVVTSLCPVWIFRWMQAKKLPLCINICR